MMKIEKGDVVYCERIDKLMIVVSIFSIDNILCMIFHLPNLKKLDLPDYLDCWIPKNALTLISKGDFKC